MRIMKGRLSNLLVKGDLAGFWILALFLMSRSSVLSAVALRKWNHNWHRDYAFSTVKKVMQRLGTNIETMSRDLWIVRNYAEKIKSDGSTTFRPIGNPAYSDRMYLYMLQCFLVMFFSKYIDKSQHAYRPKQGVVTALQELNVLLSKGYKYIWEYDLKGAFPSVNIIEAHKTFDLLGLPAPINDLLKDMSVRTIERVDLSPQGKLLPEPKFDRQVDLVNTLPEKLHSEGSFYSVGNSVSDLQQLPSSYVSKERVKAHLKFELETSEIHELLMDDDWGFTTSRPVPRPPRPSLPVKASPAPGNVGPNMLDKHASTITAPGFMENLPGSALEIKGYPQGSGTSPILFNAVFEAAVRRGHFLEIDPNIKVLSYADDFLVFSNSKLKDPLTESPTMARHGMTFSKEKSRPLMEERRWLVPSFKFLGATLHVDSFPILWEGTPRSGKHLIFDKDTMIDQFSFREVQLKKFAKSFNIELSPSRIAEEWGKGTSPFDLIPIQVMTGKAELTDQLLQRLHVIINAKFNADQEESWLERRAKDKRGKAGYGGPDEEFQESVRTSKQITKHWLDTKIAGLITNRLHGGSWKPLTKEADRSLAPKNSASWLQLRINTALANLPKTDWAFRDLPESLKSWVISRPMTIRGAIEYQKRYDQIVNLREALDGDYITDSWVTQYLNQLKVRFGSVISPDTQFVKDLSIYNSTSYASLSALQFAKNLKSSKIKKAKLTKLTHVSPI